MRRKVFHAQIANGGFFILSDHFGAHLGVYSYIQSKSTSCCISYGLFSDVWSLLVEVCLGVPTIGDADPHSSSLTVECCDYTVHSTRNTSTLASALSVDSFARLLIFEVGLLGLRELASVCVKGGATESQKHCV
jgi:hypothetical protein